MCILSGYWLSPSIKHHLCTILELWGHRGMCDHKVKWIVLKKVENKETCNSFSVLLISSIAHYSCVRTAELSRKKKKRRALPGLLFSTAMSTRNAHAIQCKLITQIQILATLLITNMFFPEITSYSQCRKILSDNKYIYTWNILELDHSMSISSWLYLIKQKNIQEFFSNNLFLQLV